MHLVYKEMSTENISKIENFPQVDPDLKPYGDALASRFQSVKAKLDLQNPAKLAPYVPLINSFVMKKLGLYRSGSVEVAKVSLFHFLGNLPKLDKSDLIAILNSEKSIIDQYNPNKFDLLSTVIDQMLSLVNEAVSPLFTSRLLIDKAKLLRYYYQSHSNCHIFFPTLIFHLSNP